MGKYLCLVKAESREKYIFFEDSCGKQLFFLQISNIFLKKILLKVVKLFSVALFYISENIRKK